MKDCGTSRISVLTYKTQLSTFSEHEFPFTSTYSLLRVYTNETVPGEGDWLEIAVARFPTEGPMYNGTLRGLLEEGV